MAECRLLVVDGSPESRGVIAEALVDQGYLVSIARDREEALQAITSDRPSLALIHVERPTEDALATLRQLREHAPDFPILVLGGGPGVQSAAQQINASGYVADPLNFGDLVASVERICPLIEH